MSFLSASAKKKELVSGDLDAAIKQYRDIVAKYPDNRAVAAEALLRMGRCYEKMGEAQSQEARKVFERVVRDFADQKEAVATASARLAAMRPSPAGIGLETKLLFQDRGEQPSNVSADGQLVAMVDWDTGDLVLLDVVTGETRKLTDKGSWATSGEFAEEPVISADGQLVVYTWFVGENTKEIRSIRSDGTGMRKHLARTNRVDDLYPAAFSPDKQTVILKGRSLQILSLADNSLKPFADSGLKLNGISFSPDSKQVVYSRQQGSGSGDNHLFLANADGSNARPLLVEESNDQYPFWSADGKRVVFISNRLGNNSLWAISVAGGAPALLKQDIGSVNPLGLGRNGSFLYWTEIRESAIQAVQFDPATLSLRGEPKRLINTYLGRNLKASFSPDGKWLAWQSARNREGAVNESVSVIIRPAAGGEEQILPVRQSPGWWAPHWFPDSKALLLVRTESNQVVLDRFEVPGGQKTEIIRAPIADADWTRTVVVAPNGKELWWIRCEKQLGKKCEIVRYDIAAKTEITSPLGEISASTLLPLAISPDGQWLAFLAHPRPAPMDFDLFVMPSGGGKPVEVARSSEGALIRFAKGLMWTPDSKNIVYGIGTMPGRGSREGLRAVPREGGASRSIPLNGAQMTMAPDWRVAYSTSSYRIELWILRGLPGF